MPDKDDQVMVSVVFFVDGSWEPLEQANDVANMLRTLADRVLEKGSLPVPNTSDNFHVHCDHCFDVLGGLRVSAIKDAEPADLMAITLLARSLRDIQAECREHQARNN